MQGDIRSQKMVIFIAFAAVQTMLHCGEELSGRGELTSAPVYRTVFHCHCRPHHPSLLMYIELIQFPCWSTIPSSVAAVMDPKLFQDHQESHKSSH